MGKAFQAHTLDPVQFLAMPHLLAMTICLAVLAIIGKLAAVVNRCVIALSISHAVYTDLTIKTPYLTDCFTGLYKAGVFGGLIGEIACYNGLTVKWDAIGVRRTTTNTVVHSIVAITSYRPTLHRGLPLTQMDLNGKATGEI